MKATKTKTRLCKGCKTKYPEQELLKINLSWFHSYDCATQYAKQKAKKDKEQADKKFKREFYEKDPKTRAKAAKEWCHRYIRERDSGKPCICCNRPLGGKFDAGHFHESGNYSRIRYHEDNIHGQRSDCNMHKGGDSGDYRVNLIKKIGQDKVDWLDSQRSGVIKRTAQDYKEIENYYKAKLKELRDGTIN